MSDRQGDDPRERLLAEPRPGGPEHGEPDLGPADLGAAELGAAELEALRAAYAPTELDPGVHEAILARALGASPAASLLRDPPALELDSEIAQPRASETERAAADALRVALEGGRSTPEAEALVSLARVLRHAHAPSPIVEIHHEALLRRALPRASRLRTVASTLVGALAAAAAGLLWLSTTSAPEPPRAALVPTRSASELFDPAEPFPRTGEESARIDRIAGARAAELRANRYASWGVR